MHLSFVPLTADGRLSAKEIVGNKKKLTQWQDKFWEHMVRKYPDLERGESASQTGRDHIPPRVFKEMTRLTKQKAKLEELLTGIGAFNAKSRAAEIAALLDKYIPAVEQMHSTIKKYQVAFTETTVENKKLKQANAQLERSLEKATQESTLKQLADAKLRRDYADAVAVLLLDDLRAGFPHFDELLPERQTGGFRRGRSSGRLGLLGFCHIGASLHVDREDARGLVDGDALHDLAGLGQSCDVAGVAEQLLQIGPAG